MAKGTSGLLRSSLLAFAMLASQPTLADYFTDAQQSSQQGETRAAIIHLKNLLQQTPDHSEGRSLLGKLLLQEKQFAAAEKELSKALELSGDPQLLVPMLVRSQLRQGKLEQALDTLSGQWDENWNPAERWLLLGNIYYGQRQLSEAEQAFYQVLQLSEDPHAILGLTLIARAHRQPEQALSTIEGAVDHPEVRDKARMLKAEILLDLKRGAEALAILDSLLESSPESPALQLQRARALLTERRFADARQQLDALPPRYRELPQYLLFSAMTAMAEKDFRRAFGDAQASLQRLPDNARGLLIAGSALYMTKDYRQAEDFLSRYNHKLPGNINGLRLLAATQQNLKRPEDALKTLEPALQQASPDAGILAIAGYSWLALGEWEKGEALLARALAINPQLKDLQSRLLFSQILGGKSEEALKALEESDSANTQQDSLRVIAWLQQQQFNAAADFVRQRIDEQPQQPAYPMLQALVELRRRNTDEAREAFLQVLKLQPGHSAALMGLARIELMENQPARAGDYFDQVLAQDNSHLGAMMGRAQVEGALGNESKMISWLEQATARQPDAIQPISSLVRYYSSRGDTARAKSEAHGFYLSHPTKADAQVLYISTLRAGGELAEAEQLASRLQQQHSRQPAYKRLLAEILRDQRKFTQALKVAQQAVNLAPEQPTGLALHTDLLIRTGQPDRARTQAENLYRDYPGAASARLLGQSWLGLGEADKAVKYLKEAAKPGFDPGLALNLSAAYLLQEQWQQASDILLQYLRKDADNPIIRLRLAAIYQQSQQYPEAIEQYRKLTRLQPANPVPWNNLAWILQQQQDPSSLRYAREALRLAPDRADIKDTLGWILVDFGDINDAIRLLQEAASQLPDNSEIRMHLARALIRGGKPAEARRQLQPLANGQSSQRDAAKQLLRELNQ